MLNSIHHLGALPKDWLLWQLADSAFPTGGFAHSGGLEAAWQSGEVQDAMQLTSYFKASLCQLGHASLPFLTAAHQEPCDWVKVDDLCDVFLSNHVANRASRLQGRAWLASTERIFNIPALDRSRFENSHEPFGCHFAPVFGVTTRWLEVGRLAASRLYFFMHLRSGLAAGVRLGILGPIKAQSIQHQLSQYAEEVLQKCVGLSLDEAAQTAPLLELWQGSQDRLYSRLFQS